MLHDDLIVSAPDAATEQLYDELIGRLWSLHEALRVASLDPAVGQVRSQIAGYAIRAVTTARGECSSHAHAHLIRLLWPTGPPDESDAWWRTPLGELLRAADRPSRSAA